MNIEELTKSQIFLLTLLTSFVTSMATGIVTVALMDQGPLTITQSVSRVIQASVEKSIPDKTSQPVAAAVAVPLQAAAAPAPAKEPDLSEVIQSVMPSLVRLYDTGGSGDFLGYGVVLDERGTILADYEMFGSIKKNAKVVLEGGNSFKISVFASDAKNSLIFLSGTATTTLKYAPATLAKGQPAVGQSVIGIFGKAGPRIASGLIVALSVPDSSSVSMITTDIDAEQIGNGAPIIDKSGAVVGISTGASRLVDSASFTPTSIISAEYDLALQTKAASRVPLKETGN